MLLLPQIMYIPTFYYYESKKEREAIHKNVKKSCLSQALLLHLRIDIFQIVFAHIFYVLVLLSHIVLLFLLQ